MIARSACLLAAFTLVAATASGAWAQYSAPGGPGSYNGAVEQAPLPPPSGGGYQNAPSPSYPVQTAPQPAPYGAGQPPGPYSQRANPYGDGQPESYSRRGQDDAARPESGPYAPQQAERRYDDAAGPYGGQRPEAGVAVEDAPLPPAPGMPNAPRPPAGMAPAQAPSAVAGLPPEDQPETETKALPPQFRRQLVHYPTKEHAGTIIIDTARTYLYLVMGDGTAIRYGIGVGREGFTWAGREKISRMAEWPDWHPPAEMIERQPYLPRFMAGGAGNPLGARALYLGNTLYRIHGTNQPSTIGKFVSSGCIRLVNDDIEDLYQRVNVGSPVVVLPNKTPTTASISR